LVGTAKRPQQPGRHETDALVAQLTDESPERNLLLRAGSRAVYHLAGYKSETISASVPPPVAESRAICSDAAAEILASLFMQEKAPLLLEALRRLETAHQLLPPELLPRALDQQQAEVRTALRPVLGERGRWLSQFHEAWHWATAGGD